MNTCKSIGCNTKTNKNCCEYHKDFYIVYNDPKCNKNKNKNKNIVQIKCNNIKKWLYYFNNMSERTKSICNNCTTFSKLSLLVPLVELCIYSFFSS